MIKKKQQNLTWKQKKREFHFHVPPARSCFGREAFGTIFFLFDRIAGTLGKIVLPQCGVCLAIYGEFYDRRCAILMDAYGYFVFEALLKL